MGAHLTGKHVTNGSGPGQIENGTLSKRFDSDFNKQIEEMIFGHDVEARKRSLQPRAVTPFDFARG